MVDFGVVVLLLAACSREEHLGHMLLAECLDEFAVIVERAVVQDVLHEEVIADVQLLVVGCVPKEVLVLAYQFSRDIILVFFPQSYKLFLRLPTI